MKSLRSIFSGMHLASERSAVIGIDIGSSSIKVVELQDKKGVLTLVTYGEIQLGPYVGKAVGESVIVNPKQEQEALIDVIRESATTASSAVFAMPLASSFVTNVTIDADKNADISAMVRVEARKVIPSSLSELTLDWAEIEFEKEASSSHRRMVLIAAIQNAALERFKVLMQFIGMTDPPTEIECFSAIRAVYASNAEDIAIVDIGATATKLYVVKKGLLMRMHRTRTGGAAATQRIASVLNVDFETAEIKKRDAANKSPESFDIKRAHDSVYDRAFRELGQVLHEYEENNSVTIKTVFLTGGGALFPGVDRLLNAALDREVSKFNAFSKVAYPAFMQDTMEEISPSFTVALGAALRVFE